MAEIVFLGKHYRFSTWSLIVFPIGTILGALAIYYGTLYWWGEWIHYGVVIEVKWLLNLFGINAQIINISPAIFEGLPVWWEILIPNQAPIIFTHDCSGFQAIAIFIALILFVPHSQDPAANAGIWRRKGKSMVVSSLLFHVVNVLRMLIQLSLYNAGLPWDSIHVSISAASSIIAAVIVLLMHRWIPEFVISIMITGKKIKAGIAHYRSHEKLQTPEESLQEYNLLQKFREVLSGSQEVSQTNVAEYLGLSEAELFPKLINWAKILPFKIKDDLIIVDDQATFMAALDKQYAEWEQET